MGRGINWTNEELQYFADLWKHTKLPYEEMQKLVNKKFKNNRTIKALSSKLTVMIKKGELPENRPSLRSTDEPIVEKPSKLFPTIKECEYYKSEVFSTHSVPFTVRLEVPCEMDLELPVGLSPEELKHEAAKALLLSFQSNLEITDMLAIHALGDIDPEVELQGGYACA